MELRCDEEQEPLPEGGILWAKGMDSYHISALNVFDGSGLITEKREIVYINNKIDFAKKLIDVLYNLCYKDK
ncbi:MAG: hypothetical protein DRH51_05375 [Candidatus Coatesbacteria bacterium]|nr:MAG: hypothetical protein DRH51_05375 [Candidatus Coatesbacteria bacterium]